MVGRITDEEQDGELSGTILEVLGSCGNILEEKIAIAEEYNLFRHEYLRKIEPKEITNQNFCRVNSFVFAIEDSRTKIVETAFSCKQLKNGRVEIAIHIANVAHYLEKDYTLDAHILQNACAVRLEDITFEMLPQELSTLCSLRPGTDKFTVSIFWEFEKNGNIINTRFAETIINPSALLTAQQMQNIAEVYWTDDDIKIYNGYAEDNLISAIQQMAPLAQLLQEKRIPNTLCTSLYNSVVFRNLRTHEPIQIMPLEQNSGRIVFTEFMFLANCTIGASIYEAFPNLAVLRY